MNKSRLFKACSFLALTASLLTISALEAREEHVDLNEGRGDDTDLFDRNRLQLDFNPYEDDVESNDSQPQSRRQQNNSNSYEADLYDRNRLELDFSPYEQGSSNNQYRQQQGQRRPQEQQQQNSSYYYYDDSRGR